MKRYAVQIAENGHWRTVALYDTRREATNYATYYVPEYATRIILVCR